MPPSRAKRSATARPTSAVGLADALQQVDRTCVLVRGRKLTYFAGCDYLRLASHPEVLAAVHEGLDRYGLNVAASRKTTGNHALYGDLESALARFAGVPATTLLSSGYVTNLVATQALAGSIDGAIIDERAHAALHDAAMALGCPVAAFAHRNVTSAINALNSLGTRGRVLLLTDGLFSHSGEIAPLDAYLRKLATRVTLLVDDAHGFGILGKQGRGTLEFLGIAPDSRVIQTVTLSKAAGVYGGAILGERAIRDRILAASRHFTGNTPLPPPLAAGAIQAMEVLRRHGGPMRRRLHFNASHVKAALRDAGLSFPDGPGPILALHPVTAAAAARTQRALIAAGIHPPFIRYGDSGPGYFRFVISSEHSAAQLDALVDTLRHCANAFRKHGHS